MRMRSPKMYLMILGVIATMSACRWNPEVTAVPITPPWSSLNLPVKEGSVVWRSSPDEFRAVHRDGKQAVTKSYTEALKAGGWKLAHFDESGERYVVDMTRGSESLNIEFYDFDNTGVMIKKQ